MDEFFGQHAGKIFLQFGSSSTNAASKESKASSGMNVLRMKDEPLVVFTPEKSKEIVAKAEKSSTDDNEVREDSSKENTLIPEKPNEVERVDVSYTSAEEWSDSEEKPNSIESGLPEEKEPTSASKNSKEKKSKEIVYSDSDCPDGFISANKKVLTKRRDRSVRDQQNQATPSTSYQTTQTLDEDVQSLFKCIKPDGKASELYDLLKKKLADAPSPFELPSYLALQRNFLEDFIFAYHQLTSKVAAVGLSEVIFEDGHKVKISIEVYDKVAQNVAFKNAVKILKDPAVDDSHNNKTSKSDIIDQNVIFESPEEYFQWDPILPQWLFDRRLLLLNNDRFFKCLLCKQLTKKGLDKKVKYCSSCDRKVKSCRECNTCKLAEDFFDESLCKECSKDQVSCASCDRWIYPRDGVFYFYNVFCSESCLNAYRSGGGVPTIIYNRRNNTRELYERLPPRRRHSIESFHAETSTKEALESGGGGNSEEKNGDRKPDAVITFAKEVAKSIFNLSLY